MSRTDLLTANESLYKHYKYTLWNEISGTLVCDEAPDGFKDEFTIERHKSFFGLFRKYSDQTVHFVKKAREYLWQIKESQGINAEVTLKVERIDEDWEFETIFEGVVTMSSLKFTDITAECQIEDNAGLVKFQDRKQTNVNVYGEKTLDGLEMAAANDTVYLETAYFYLKANFESFEYLDPADPGIHLGRILPMDLVGSEYEDDPDVNTDIVAQEPTVPAFGGSFNIFASNFFYAESSAAVWNGTLQGTLRLDYDYDNETFDLYLRINNSGGVSQSLTQITLNEVSDGVYEYSQDFSLQPGQFAVLYYNYEYIGNPLTGSLGGLYFQLNCEPSTFEVVGIGETFPAFTAYGMHIYTAFERLTYMTSHLDFDSTYLDKLTGLHIHVLPGMSFRGKYRPNLAISIEDLFKSLYTVYPVGLGYENDKIIVEDFDYFFDSDIGKDLSDRVTPGDIETEYLPDFFNQVTFGFAKSVSEYRNGLGEFNTKVEYSTSTKFDKKKTVVSPYRGDTIGMTKLRDRSLSRYPGEDVDGDEDVFMLRTRLDGATYKSKGSNGYDNAPSGWENLDFAPARAIRRHRFLEYLSANSELRLEKRDKDTTLVSQDTGEALIDENANIPAEEFPERLFRPEKITVNTYMTRDEVDALDYKKLIKLDNDISGWILKLTKNYKNENVELELLRSWS